jgi:tetratricopeptide (TPR) repeat protein
MKKLLFLILLILPRLAFSQYNDLVQNFYESCKAKNYSAFNYINTGIQLFDTRQYLRSINKFERALEKDSTCCDAWYLIGYSYQRIANFEKAIESCNRSLDINQNNMSALIIKANTLFLMKDTINAIAVFKKAMILDPNKIDAYYGLALILHLSGKDKEANGVFSEMERQGVKTKSLLDNSKVKQLRNSIK